MSSESNNRVNVESEAPTEPRDDQVESNDGLQLSPETDEPMPEEAGYGHGV